MLSTVGKVVMQPLTRYVHRNYSLTKSYSGRAGFLSVVQADEFMCVARAPTLSQSSVVSRRN